MALDQLLSGEMQTGIPPELLFGDASKLSDLLLRAGNRNVPLLGLAARLAKLAHNPKLPSWIAFRQQERLASAARHTLAGEAAVLRGVHANSVGDLDNARWQFAIAVEQFNAAWDPRFVITLDTSVPETTLTQEVSSIERSPWQALILDDEATKLLPPHSRENAVGYWTTHDLIFRIATRADKTSEAWRTVYTPIVGGMPGGQGNRLLWLTVELCPVRNGGPFCPDPLYLGLSSIVAEPEPLFEAMNEVWDVSGLGARFRGRWRITNPPEIKRGDGGPLFPSRFLGNSAQAAALCAVLAASGNPYQEDLHQDTPAEPLVDDVAITAQLGPLGVEDRLADRQLGPVGGIPEKVGNSYRALDTLVFATEEYTGPDRFQDLVIEHVQTVGEALDLLLVTNRYLKKYQHQVREKWLTQWAPRTARHPEDDGPGPDDENEPVEMASDSDE